MPSKTVLTSVAYTLIAMALINKVEFLKPVKKMIMDEGLL